MTNILYTMLLSNVLCANEHVYTHENIFEELVECQSQVIESQKNCFELHKFDTFIVISFKDNKDGLGTMLDAKISELINEYIEVVGNKEIKITAKIFDNPYETIDHIKILQLFQNAYTFNYCITNGIKTNIKIYEEFDYYTTQNVDCMHQINDALDKGKMNGQIQCKCHKCERNESWYDGFWFSTTRKMHNDDRQKTKCLGVYLIDNCLITLQDYKLFYNEFVKSHRIVVYEPTCLIFIALKLDEMQQTKFIGTKSYQYLSNEQFNDKHRFYYKAVFLENRTPFGNDLQNNIMFQAKS